jgi:hypothetical protein
MWRSGIFPSLYLEAIFRFGEAEWHNPLLSNILERILVQDLNAAFCYLFHDSFIHSEQDPKTKIQFLFKSSPVPKCLSQP